MLQWVLVMDWASFVLVLFLPILYFLVLLMLRLLSRPDVLTLSQLELKMVEQV